MRTLFDEPIQVQDHRPVLLPIQRDLLERGRQAFLTNRRVIWQATCGAGKTVIASQQTLLALEKNKRVMHVVHRRRLVDQMIGTLKKFDIFASPIMEGRLTWTSQVYCASRDTLLAMLKNGTDLPRVDLLIVDEAHVAAHEVMAWYLQNCPAAYWCGYTASPVRPDGSSMNPPWQALVCMQPASELIKIGRLVPVKVFNPDAVGRRRKKGEKVKPAGDPVEHWKKYAKDLPTVVFASTVAASQDICQRYNNAGIRAEHIDAMTNEDEREEIFERSRLGITKIICNCAVLIEGVDLPWLVCCQILRGCNSLVLWIQSNGRVMRSFPGKTHGICLDHSAAAFEFGSPDSDFQWTLEDEKANSKANKPSKDRKPIACPSCGFVFVGKPICPECGKVMPKQRRKTSIAMENAGDGVLTEFNGQQQQINRDAAERLWTRLLHIGKAKGWAMRVVAGIFSKEAKRQPWEVLGCSLPKGKEGWAMSVSEWMMMQ